jgi:hypothetical protein
MDVPNESNKYPFLIPVEEWGKERRNSRFKGNRPL